MNAATTRLVHLIARVLETEAWQGFGIRSASHWVAWRCGVSPARAKRLVLMARRLAELPGTRAAFEEGALCEDQVAVVCHHADAFVALADRSLGGASRPHHDRNLVLLHIGTDRGGETNGHLHLGTGVSAGMRRFVGCDARIRPVLEAGGKAVSVGRAFRTMPDRTRTTPPSREARH